MSQAPLHRLLVVLGIMLAWTAAQLLASYFSGALVLLADAGHMLGHSLIILVAAGAAMLGKKSTSPDKIEAFGGLLNAIVLIFMGAMVALNGLTYMQHHGMHHHSANAGTIMAVMGFLGLLVHGGCAWYLKACSHNLNARGVFLHMLFYTSITVMIMLTGVMVQFYNWYRMDTIVALLMAALMIFSGARLGKASCYALLGKSSANAGQKSDPGV